MSGMSTPIISMLTGRYLEHTAGCRCHECEVARSFTLLDDLQRTYGCKTVSEVIAEHGLFTDEQRSLAHSPEPPHIPTGGSDCRIGGSCGLDFSDDTPRAKWERARFRMRREQRRTLNGHT